MPRSRRERPREARLVSMESGLEGRNNKSRPAINHDHPPVSMESGLEGRNNVVRCLFRRHPQVHVSMESGLEGRNNRPYSADEYSAYLCLNGVRPRRPEQ